VTADSTFSVPRK